METFVSAAAGFPKDLRHAKPSDKAFSATEILYHMISVEELWQKRFKRLLSEGAHTFAALDPDEDAKSKRLNDKDFERGIGLLQDSRERTIAMLSSLTNDQLQLSGLHPRYGSMSVVQIMEKMLSHDLGHADQFRRTLEGLRTNHVQAAR